MGFGPANLHAILYLLENSYPGHLITVIEKGKSIKKRDKEKDILYGTGGAGSYSDNKCIYSLQPDQPIFDYIPVNEIQGYYKTIQDLTVQFHPNPIEISITEPQEIPNGLKNSGITNTFESGWGGLSIKQSLCWHIGSKRGFDVLNNMEDYIMSMGVNILFNTTMTDIDIDSKTLMVRQQFDDSYGLKRSFKYDEIYIALGKTGKKFINEFSQKYNLETINDEVNMGVRFETPFNNIIEDIARNFQYDFKFTKRYNNMDIRTFCVCHNSAYVACEEFEDHGRIRLQSNGEGYGLEVQEKINGLTNFGILGSFKTPDADKYVKNITESLNNQLYMVRGDGVTFQTSLTRDVPEMSKKEFTHIFGELGVNILKFIEDLKPVLGYGENYYFYPPEIKESPKKLQVTDNFELKEIKDVYILGDVLNTRGIIPAATEGLRAVEHLIKGTL